MLKVAQGATHEVVTLREESGICAQSFIDLHHIALNLRTTPRSLQGLVALFLKRRLSKEQRLTDWEQIPLTQAQIEYAATDAWVSRQVLLAIRKSFLVEKLDCERLIGSAAGTPEPQTEKASSTRCQSEEPFAACVDAAQANSSVLEASPAQAPPVEPHQKLAALCMSRGYLLRFAGFESAPGGFRCVFEVEYRHHGRSVAESFRSKRVHSAIRAAQNDAALEALARLPPLVGLDNRVVALDVPARSF